jgi:hypothetical protein
MIWFHQFVAVAFAGYLFMTTLGVVAGFMPAVLLGGMGVIGSGGVMLHLIRK